MQVTPWLERRLRLAVSAAASVPGPADAAADARLMAALAHVPRPLLSRMLALAGTVDDDDAAAMLAADPALMAAIEGLIGLG